MQQDLVQLAASIEALNKRLCPEKDRLRPQDPLLHPYSPRLWQLVRTKEHVKQLLLAPELMNQQSVVVQNQSLVPTPLHIPSEDELKSYANEQIEVSADEESSPLHEEVSGDEHLSINGSGTVHSLNVDSLSDEAL